MVEQILPKVCEQSSITLFFVRHRKLKASRHLQTRISVLGFHTVMETRISTGLGAKSEPIFVRRASLTTTTTWSSYQNSIEAFPEAYDCGHYVVETTLAPCAAWEKWNSIFFDMVAQILPKVCEQSSITLFFVRHRKLKASRHLQTRISVLGFHTVMETRISTGLGASEPIFVRRASLTTTTWSSYQKLYVIEAFPEAYDCGHYVVETRSQKQVGRPQGPRALAADAPSVRRAASLTTFCVVISEIEAFLHVAISREAWFQKQFAGRLCLVPYLGRRHVLEPRER